VLTSIKVEDKSSFIRESDKLTIASPLGKQEISYEQGKLKLF